jgi:hypothetical protein
MERTIGAFINKSWDGYFDHYSIPGYMREGLRNYIENHQPPGHFLRAILENDLREACIRADDTNRHLLWNYVNFLYNEAPVACWGSPQIVKEWLQQKDSK